MTETVTFTGDPAAESTVLAACLNVPTATAAARRTLTPDSFWRTDHAAVFAAAADLDDRSRNVDPYSVYDQLRAGKRLAAAGGGALIHTLYAYPFAGPSVPWAIRRVANLSRQRQRAAVAQRIGQIGTEVADPDDMADALAAGMVELEALIDDRSDDDTVPGLQTWDQFMARPPRDSDSVIPGLLDRQEAVMVLAAPGVGKSWLSRQMALTVASGVHPFHPSRRITPMRTLLVDLENPESTVQRQTHEPYYAIRRLAGGQMVGDRGWFWPHTEGLNIRKRGDAALFERVIADTRPDLVCVGSLYNLFARGSSDWDTAAEETQAVLNRIRARYGCAFWIEHHMPRASEGGHRQSPFGSTLWERWPSYGRVIKRVSGGAYAFSVFRGDREAGREFPAGLERGGRLPWSPIWDSDDPRLEGES